MSSLVLHSRYCYLYHALVLYFLSFRSSIHSVCILLLKQLVWVLFPDFTLIWHIYGFADKMIVYVEKSERSIGKLLLLLNEFSTVTRYQVKIQKLFYFYLLVLKKMEGKMHV